jgi:hypothetical protein
LSTTTLTTICPITRLYSFTEGWLMWVAFVNLKITTHFINVVMT